LSVSTELEEANTVLAARSERGDDVESGRARFDMSAVVANHDLVLDGRGRASFGGDEASVKFAPRAAPQPFRSGKLIARFSLGRAVERG
jgi:hypothetical protein